MFYTVYKTTHLGSGKIYVGMHTTKNPNDNYLGSGTLINRAIKKYGRDAFVKEVLFVFSTPEEMISKEKDLVDLEFVARDDTYNLNVGGDGSWFRANQSDSPEKREIRTRLGQKAFREKLLQDPALREQWATHSRANLNKAISSPNATNGGWTGKTHSESSREMMRKTHRSNLHQQGVTNSQHGTIWVVQPGHPPIKIIASCLSSYLEQGFRRGRK